MTISKKLTALFAGVLLAGSFGLAGCDDSSSDAGANGSGSSSSGAGGSDTTNVGSSGACSAAYCFGDEYTDTGVPIEPSRSTPEFPADIYVTSDTYIELEEYFDEWCFEDGMIAQAEKDNYKAKFACKAINTYSRDNGNEASGYIRVYVK